MKTVRGVITYSSILLLYLFVACSPLELIEAQEEDAAQEIEIRTKSSNESDIFYYYFGEKIYLQERNDLLFMRFTDSESREHFLSESVNGVSSLKLYDPEGDGRFASESSFNLLILESVSGIVSDDLVCEVNERDDIVTASRLLEYQGRLMASDNDFAVKIKQGVNIHSLETVAKRYDCLIDQREWSGENVYYLIVPKTSSLNTITLSSLFYETGLFEFSSPDFYAFDVLCSNDAQYSNQWGLKNTGQYNNTSGKDINIEPAWNITDGSSDIVVAVLDDGVDLSHSDLAANLITGYDAIYNGVGGDYVLNDDVHGTAVAGVIGAVKDNTIGIAGVAPGCKLMPVRMLDHSVYSFNYEAAIRGINWALANGADVINCSWYAPSPDEYLTSAIQNAYSIGRNGKGCVIVFASGNENTSVNYPAYLGSVIAVGAITYDGLRKEPTFWILDYWGSNYGPALDLVAPGVMIPTTKRQSTYYTELGGTSLAAPHVAGVAALILSEYPDLTPDQVKRAMERSADRPSSYTYVSDYQYPSGKRNDQVGYGIVNAYGALSVASQIHQQNIIDALSGFDVTITNNTSYTIDDISVELYGTIGGSTVTLFSENMELVEGGGHMVGYPVYRGAELYASPGTTIPNISLEFYASCSSCPDNLRIAVAIDNSTPTNFESFYFGDGDFYIRSLPNSTVPNASRRRLYIYIINS